MTAHSAINVSDARKSCYIAPYGQPIVRAILSGDCSHKAIKVAFDWDGMPEGHKYWASVHQAAQLSSEARTKLTGYLHFAERSNPSPQALARTIIPQPPSTPHVGTKTQPKGNATPSASTHDAQAKRRGKAEEVSPPPCTDNLDRAVSG